MKIILLSGGAGKRLWPLSSEILPKQFMKILRTPSGESISMVQKTWGILADKFGIHNLFISAGLNHESVLREQLGPDVRLILEPSQRDTFPAIAVASSYLSSIEIHPDETVIVLPVDAYVDPAFYDKLNDLDHIIQQDFARLALIGIQPSFPAEKFGYILPIPSSNPYYSRVNSFHEKPDRASAGDLIDQGALWNGGVFAFRLAYMEEIVSRLIRTWSYKELTAAYDTIPRISFDYMVVEPEKRIICVKYVGKWTDLGTWTEMLRVIEPDECNNVIKDDSCEGTHVINQLSIPIVIAGIKNAVIAAGPDGILISDKSVSHMIKPLVDQLDFVKTDRLI
ncbi:sugar phosphate nucleotidyltransferase [Cohnella silvisoli]|uniref:Sugar phosphate nucleotidyltransferase n=1 Tax=Cohnella silvisoli TaxID=2873699 RepID=A0ABV1KZ71_9BACL|nr:sugar phosphate nucleotidyltransferase [Cohnella silvisoli]MCD9024478.1 mannose-1-phosphate guanylyltransferase [Cohnella silvisoli]